MVVAGKLVGCMASEDSGSATGDIGGVRGEETMEDVRVEWDCCGVEGTETDREEAERARALGI